MQSSRNGLSQHSVQSSDARANGHSLESDDSSFDESADPTGRANNLLSDDPLNGARDSPRVAFGLSLPRFFSSDIGDGPPTPTTPITPISPGANLRRRHTPTPGNGESSNYFDGASDNNGQHAMNGEDYGEKEPQSAVDWYQEGPGRRVGYEDLTAIDWIFEYAKERQRLRLLMSSAAGAVGQLKRLMDASQIWVILVLTGIMTGAIAACIDVISDWLGDVKQGVCKAGLGGGKFYLNKTFCCWGLDGNTRRLHCLRLYLLTTPIELAQCQGWMFWSQALGIESVGGGYIAEYIFFIMFSVGLHLLRCYQVLSLTKAGIICYMCCYPSTAICAVCPTKWYTRSEDHAGWFRDKEILNELDVDCQVCWTSMSSFLQVGYLAYISVVSDGGLWSMAGQRGSSRPCSLLYSESIAPADTYIERQRRYDN